MTSPPFKVKAVYDYSSPHEDDLGFTNGQIITVTDEEDTEWYYGEFEGPDGKHQGLFPRNFVERYEPTTPPRPSRRAKRDEAESSKPEQSTSDAPPVPEIPQQAVHAVAEPEREPEPSRDVQPMVAKAEVEEDRRHEEIAQNMEATLASKPPQQPVESRKLIAQTTSPEIIPNVTKSPPPAVASKPIGGSFRDRIAAFNKPAAPPVAPMKPGGLGQSSNTGFVKKQYVAPPPSRNAYVPPPREPPAKVFRREEDPSSPVQSPPETKAMISPPIESSADEQGEEQPKPTSLKERIALLQKQQLEQAARHAEAAQKKEKPKRPPKKRMVSQQDVTESVGNDVSTMTSKEETHQAPAPETEDEETIDTTRFAKRRSKSKDETPLASPSSAPQELMIDTNDADQSAEADTEDAGEAPPNQRQERKVSRTSVPPPPPRQAVPVEQQDTTSDEVDKVHENRSEGHDEEEEEEAEDDVDPEVRRRMEIRERMAKMSGGMGMAGMFGPPGGLPPMAARKTKTSGSSAKKQPTNESFEEQHGPSSPPVQAMALPGMSMPGVQRVKSPEVVDEPREAREKEDKTLGLGIQELEADTSPDDDEEGNDNQEHPLPAIPCTQRGPPPPVPDDRASAPPPPPAHNQRAVPPPPPTNARPPPPLPPGAGVASPGSGSESDDELSSYTNAATTPLVAKDAPHTNRQPPPIPSATRLSGQAQRPEEPRSPPRNNESNPTQMSPTSPVIPNTPAKRSSQVPPIPGASPMIPSLQTRAPPPIPATQPTSTLNPNALERQDIVPAARDDDSEEEVTEYDGDYDTDIASGATHKEALRSHEKDSSVEDTFTGDEASYHHQGLPSLGPPPGPPPVPSSSAPRVAPPPLPTQPPRQAPQPMSMPRVAPPPPPPAKDEVPEVGDDYDPYNYAAPRKDAQAAKSREAELSVSSSAQNSYDDLYDDSPTEETQPIIPSTSTSYPTSLPPTAAPSMPRQSLDVPRKSTSRRSVDAQRPSMDQGFIAEDVDLNRNSHWWMQRRMPPPIFQHRNDVSVEVEESTTLQRDREITIKHVYALFMDYSQTVITARFDSRDALKVDFGQRHEPPPPRLRQDQLEDAHSKYGARLAEMANTKLNSVVGNGNSLALVMELFNSLSGALPPIGTRAFGALIYTNLANASVQQLDEIRAGDIVSFRNAKLQGHRGRPIKQKYNMEVGKPDHVGIVVDWDGTKKKVRAWEQGRESKKVKIESFKLGDLRSGEVKVWRVVSREWVGWGGTSR